MDRFIFAAGGGHDVTQDFAANATDFMVLQAGTGTAGFNALRLQHVLTDGATGFVKIVTGANWILLDGHHLSDFDTGGSRSAADFLFG